jgi:hypothetical protein
LRSHFIQQLFRKCLPTLGGKVDSQWWCVSNSCYEQVPRRYFTPLNNEQCSHVCLAFFQRSQKIPTKGHYCYTNYHTFMSRKEAIYIVMFSPSWMDNMYKNLITFMLDCLYLFTDL